MRGQSFRRGRFPTLVRVSTLFNKEANGRHVERTTAASEGMAVIVNHLNPFYSLSSTNLFRRQHPVYATKTNCLTVVT
jgi:hypothetical protein